jgi:hypothetical protein
MCAISKTTSSEFKIEINKMNPNLANYELSSKIGKAFSLISEEIEKKSVLFLQLKEKLLSVISSFPDETSCKELSTQFDERLNHTLLSSSAEPNTSDLFFGKNTPSLFLSPFGGNRYSKKILQRGELHTISDVKVLEFINTHSIPCSYHPEIRSIVPARDSYPIIQSKWRELRDPIRDAIGDIQVQQYSPLPITWENSAQTVEKLLEDTANGAVIFVNLVTEIARYSQGTAHFGPNKMNLTKSEASILDKVSRTQTETGGDEAYAISHIEDGIRGTISFQTPEQLKKGLNAFISKLTKLGYDIDVSNIWKNEFDYSGYLDVDAKIRIRLPEAGSGKSRYVMAEIQFHLDEFYDGGKDCAVSRAHKIYEVIRLIPVLGRPSVNLSFTELNETSRLYFTAALYQAHKKF